MDSLYFIEPAWIVLPFLLLFSIGYLWNVFHKGKASVTLEKDKMCNTRKFTSKELSSYDNSNPNLPVYLAIKGTVFDVTSNRESYPYDKGYGIFAGKDASRALAKSSLNKEDCVPEWSDLPPEQIKVLDDWYSFYKKKYSVVGEIKEEDSAT